MTTPTPPFALDLDAVERMLEEATSGAEWFYRPGKDDDWGFVRDAAGRLVAVAKAGRYLSPADEQEHFEDGTDPAAAKGRLIGATPSTIRALVARVQALEQALRPFAKFADRFGDTARDDNWVLTRNPSGKGDLTMGDVRHARAELLAGKA